DGLGLQRAARSGARKLLAGLPPDERRRVQALAELIELDDDPPGLPPGRAAVFDAILQALGSRTQIRIWVRDLDGQDVQVTKLSPSRLVAAQGTWRLIGRSPVHRRVQSFPLGRIVRVVPTADLYTVPPRFRHGRLPGWDGPPVPIRLRLAPGLAEEFRNG